MFTAGLATIGGGGTDSGGDHLRSFKVTVPHLCTVQSFAFYIVASGPGTNIRIGLYDTSAGEPNALIAQTAESALANGWNTFPSTTRVQIVPGLYWFAWHLSTGTPTWRFDSVSTAGVNHYRSQAYGALPNPFGGPNSQFDLRASAYFNLLESPYAPAPVTVPVRRSVLY